MNNAWQLAVVDWDMAIAWSRRHNNARLSDIEAAVKRARNGDAPVKDGSICFIVSIKDEETKDGLSLARIWIPDTKMLGLIAFQSLRPILTDKDKIEMNLKFGIDFAQYE